MFTCVRPLQTCVYVLDMCLPQVLDVLKIFSKLSQKCFRWFQSGLRRASGTFQACFGFKHGFKMIQIYFGNYLVASHHNHRQQTNIKHDVTKTSNRIPENAPTRLTRPADGGWRNAALPLPLGTILKPYFFILRPKHLLVRNSCAEHGDRGENTANLGSSPLHSHRQSENSPAKCKLTGKVQTHWQSA